MQFVSNVVNDGKQIPDSNGETYSNAEYLVVNDIECPEGVNFVPIGTSENPFNGVFNGNGKRIKGLTVNGDNASSVGLFGFVSNCTITGVGLEPGKTEEGTEYGGITNTLSQNATLKSTGGLVGTVTGETTISNCYNWLNVNAVTTATSDVFAVGGIVGIASTYYTKKGLSAVYTHYQIKADKKNSKQKRVVALTDEYIKSLENYLNNPNDEIRLMASKEILMRLDEDKDRYNDAALNALLNKMLQDPSKLIRVAALSAFASQLASGNDFTVELLHNIQANPSADKEDVLQAADILLKMSGGTEVKNIPNPAVKEEAPQDGVKGQ